MMLFRLIHQRAVPPSIQRLRPYRITHSVLYPPRVVAPVSNCVPMLSGAALCFFITSFLVISFSYVRLPSLAQVRAYGRFIAAISRATLGQSSSRFVRSPLASCCSSSHFINSYTNRR